MKDTHLAADAAARALAQDLLAADHAALATLLDGAPMATRVGCLWEAGQGMLLLISDLSDHGRTLQADPRCSLLVGDPGPRGDPLTHPRITLLGRAVEVDKTDRRAGYLAARPKAKLYYDFTDFRLYLVAPETAMLNGGFGKAYRLTSSDLGLP